MRESPRIFHLGESSDMSHHWFGQTVNQPQAPQAPQCSTMPTFLAMENEGPQEQALIEYYFVEYDSQSQIFKDHLSFQDFVTTKTKEDQRNSIEMVGSFIIRIDTTLWEDYSFPSLILLRDFLFWS